MPPVSAATDKMQAEGLPAIAIDTFAHYEELLRQGDQGTLPESELEPLTEVPSAEDLPDPAPAVLERAVVLGDLSRPGLAKALESLDSVTFGGLANTYRYGPVEAREPPRTNTIFAIDPTNPIGMRVVASGVGSDAARAWRFERRKP